MDNSPFLRKKEVCDRLNVSPRTVDRLIADGELDAVRINARVTRITAESLEAYLRRVAA
jgi:excisionase family DNA binding protein